MTPEVPQPEKIASTGNTTGRRLKSDYHKGMDATALALSISNHLKYSLAKHPEGATLHDQYLKVLSALESAGIETV